VDPSYSLFLFPPLCPLELEKGEGRNDSAAQKKLIKSNGAEKKLECRKTITPRAGHRFAFRMRPMQIP
jgi:hypothetical protein